MDTSHSEAGGLVLITYSTVFSFVDVKKYLFIALVVYHLESYGILTFFTDNGTF